ncbi:MAG: nucleoside phosphorylase [Oscillospiraceae bacterium]|jgi:uridine phosphorylase|nr:nucleoside phosphorylase [Oscillospiraceae bacterium]
MALLDESIQFHLRVTAGQVGKYAILPGDPGRVLKIAAYLDEPEHMASNREYVTYTGGLDGEPVSVVSTGIGGPSAAIAVEELFRCGCRVFIRVGTCGGINAKVTGGDLVIVSAAVRGDGASKEYLPPDYPAAADFGVVTALAEAAKELSTGGEGDSFHVGVAQSKDSFYGEIEPGKMPVADFLTSRWDAFVKCGCLASEMEAAAIFAVALARGARAGAVLTALWNVERSKAGLPDRVCESGERAVKCAVNAIRALIARDKQGE